MKIIIMLLFCLSITTCIYADTKQNARPSNTTFRHPKSRVPAPKIHETNRKKDRTWGIPRPNGGPDKPIEIRGIVPENPADNEDFEVHGMVPPGGFDEDDGDDSYNTDTWVMPKKPIIRDRDDD